MTANCIPLFIFSPYHEGFWSDLRPWLEANIREVRFFMVMDEDFTESIKRFFSIAPEKFRLLGFCMGGYVACNISAIAPERTVGLVLLNCNLTLDSTAQAIQRSHRIRQLELKANEISYPDEQYLDYASRFLLAPSNAMKYDMVNKTKDVLSIIPISVSILQQKSMLTRKKIDLSRMSNVPLIRIYGQYDRICSHSKDKEVNKYLYESVSKVIPVCGHMTPIEKPDHVIELLSEWLN